MSYFETFSEILNSLEGFKDQIEGSLSIAAYYARVLAIRAIRNHLELDDNLETLPYEAIKEAYRHFDQHFNFPPQVSEYILNIITPLIVKIKTEREANISRMLDEQINSIKLDEDFPRQIESILAFCQALLGKKYCNRQAIHTKLITAKMKLGLKEELWEIYRDGLIVHFKPHHFSDGEYNKVPDKLAILGLAFRSAREHRNPRFSEMRSRSTSAPVLLTESDSDELNEKVSSLQINH